MKALYALTLCLIGCGTADGQLPGFVISSGDDASSDVSDEYGNLLGDGSLADRVSVPDPSDASDASTDTASTDDVVAQDANQICNIDCVVYCEDQLYECKVKCRENAYENDDYDCVSCYDSCKYKYDEKCIDLCGHCWEDDDNDCGDHHEGHGR